MKKLIVILASLIISGCAIPPDPGSVTHKKTSIEEPDGTTTTMEETTIIQPEGSKTQTSYNFTQEPFSLSGIFGSQYNWVSIRESIRQKFKAMKPFIWAGIFVVLGGVLCMVKRWCNTKVGIATIVTGIGFSLFGTLMPIYGVYVFWGLVAAGIVVVAYMTVKYTKTKAEAELREPPTA